MKTTILKRILFSALLTLVGTVLSAPATYAAYVFYTFDTTANGTGAFTLAPGGSSGFVATSNISYAGSKLGTDGGAATYTDPAGNTWTGSGASGTPGHSISWGDPSTGNSFSVTLNTTGLKDLSVRLDVRAANTGTSVLKTFSAFTYSIDGAAPVAIPATLSFTTGSNQFYEWTADLSSIVALNNQSNVKLTWSLASLVGNGSVRIDNVEIRANSAIPEPATTAILLGVFGVVACMVTRQYRSRS
ncbi:hypothetical protein Ga0100231_010625 [Opitutaceae bacterium TAV4]|nr:hypothetical protein Ga0100231_010625 [Opitutaceae bacterium TAV4]RRJ98798.1 hypothetical protein Ga0100230_010735 [Opitutaceae bacterium TAV3]